MKLMLIASSHREKSESYRVVTILKKHYLLNNLFHTIEHLNLCGFNLDFWNENLNDESANEWNILSTKLALSDAFIFVVPEWHGMVPAKLKNLLLFCNKNELAHKPVLLISISSGNGGVYSLAELRMSSHKNTKICYIPESIVIRKVNSFDFNNYLNSELIGYIESCFHILYNYSVALQSIRHSNLGYLEQYPNGM